MASALYSKAILQLAAKLEHNRHLDHPDATAEMRAPICGSRISADISLGKDGTLQQIALRANACALGQASAAILVAHAAGNDGQAIAAMRDEIAAYLGGDASAELAWPELNEFAGARDYPARHGAILLPYDAVLAAFAKTI